mmetsp:Transcript_12616/g.37516  ORF Transcript_12616/g.37516 Transcript_12616/m.37516 type:complete len:326 (-) Transcript_12616:27-1004(-)
MMRAALILLPALCAALSSSIRFDAAPQPLNAGAETHALYPLAAVYLPGGEYQLRNIEPRNVRMCREETEFVAALVGGERQSCAAIGTLMRIDGVEAATRDESGAVLAEPQAPRALRVNCTAIGRRRIISVRNPGAWNDPAARLRGEYLVAETLALEDEPAPAADATSASGALGFLARTLRTSSENSFATEAAAALLDDAARLASIGEDWRSLELWQQYCATRRASAAEDHRADRNELIIDEKVKEGGEISIPVNEQTLSYEARARLADLDARAADALAQMELDDETTFLEFLSSRDPSARLARLADDAFREGTRVAQRVALERAL